MTAIRLKTEHQVIIWPELLITGGHHHIHHVTQASDGNGTFRISPEQVQRPQGDPGLHVPSLHCPDTSLSFITMGGVAGAATSHGCRRGNTACSCFEDGSVPSQCWLAVDHCQHCGSGRGGPRDNAVGRPFQKVLWRTYAHNVCAHTHTHTHTHTL